MGSSESTIRCANEDNSFPESWRLRLSSRANSRTWDCSSRGRCMISSITFAAVIRPLYSESKSGAQTRRVAAGAIKSGDGRSPTGGARLYRRPAAAILKQPKANLVAAISEKHVKTSELRLASRGALSNVPLISKWLRLVFNTAALNLFQNVAGLLPPCCHFCCHLNAL